MLDWRRNEPFCNYVDRRKAQRRHWVDVLYDNAANENSRHLADKLAARWGLKRR